ncbi:metal ABC transporter substrate-binding protein [Pseudomonas sp.]|uniref:metal ABC transporter substrate-binding protein n=1 Tax=Pseudomonas sp. TaxID=306 RepID=UPI0027171E85|nr:metal ABC transporter substrate-binding protein [Pseudomonas sp.]MDO8707083.1 metal ABC transporter substrate-binding protein [Pseudomonas sp.]
MFNPKLGLWPFLFFVLLLTSSYDAVADERIKIVTTIPTLKEFVKQVGGERVEVLSLLKGGEDLHTFDPRPSDTRAVYNADIVVKVGIGLDGWVDRVVKASGNKKLLVIEASRGVNVISSPGENPSHTHGNPHIWHDPENAKVMIENIYQALIKASPAGSDYFRANRDGYIARLSELDKELDADLSGIKDRRVITYHPGWGYLLRRLKLQELFSIEKAPGREPSAREIAGAINQIKSGKIRLILGEPEAPKKLLDIISKESRAVAVNLAPEIGSVPEATGYIEMMRYNIREIAKGLK